MLETRSGRSHANVGGTVIRLVAAIVMIAGMSAGQAAASGGTVAGTVKFKGTPPPAPAAVEITTNHETCGAKQTPEQLVGPDGAVRWAVVRILGVEGEFPADAPPPTLDQQGCKFTPHVVAVPVGIPLKVLNNDGILHNFHTFPENNTPINRAQPAFRKTMDVTFDKPEIVRVGCDVHPWMNGHVVVTDTPFVAVTGADGSFSIEGVPAGAYSVSVWHESFGEQTLKVNVAEGKTSSLPVTVAAK